MVYVEWCFGWLPYSGKHNSVVLGAFLCLITSMKLGGPGLRKTPHSIIHLGLLITSAV